MQELIPWHNDDPIEIGQKIRQLRKRQKISQEQLAERMGFEERNTVYRHEKGQNTMSACTLLRYADALHVDPCFLLPNRYQAEPAVIRTREAGNVLEKLSEENYRKILELAQALLNMESKVSST